jgi:hypothetical protein
LMLIPAVFALVTVGLVRAYGSAGSDQTPVSVALGILTVLSSIGSTIVFLTVLPVGIGSSIWGLMLGFRNGLSARMRVPLVVFGALLVANLAVIAWWISI